MQTVAQRNQWLVLAGFILLCLATGSIGGFATQESIDTWYRGLAKPWRNPPDWVFAPVWTLLYIMMGIAAWLVWKTRDRIGPAMALCQNLAAPNMRAMASAISLLIANVLNLIVAPGLVGALSDYFAGPAGATLLPGGIG